MLSGVRVSFIREGSSFSRALMSFFVAVIGGGVVFIPHDLKNSGILVGLLLLGFTGWLSHENCRIMDLTAKLCQAQGVSKINGVEDIGRLAGKRLWGPTGGKLMYGLISTINLVDLYLTALQKLAFFFDCTRFSLKISWDPSAFSLQLWTYVLTAAAFIFVVFADNVDFLSRISWLGAFSMFTVIGLMILGSLWVLLRGTGDASPLAYMPNPQAQGGLVSSLGSIWGNYIFGYAAVETYLYILRGMRNPCQGFSVSLFGHMIAGGLYGLTALICYGAFRESLDPVFFETPGVSWGVQMAMCVFLMIGSWPAFLLFFLPILEQLEGRFALRKGHLRLGCRMVTMGVTLFLAAIFPVDQVTQFTGNFTTGAICLLFPGGLYWMLTTQAAPEFESLPANNFMHVLKDSCWRRTWVVTGLSFAGFGVGLFFAGYSIWQGISQWSPENLSSLA